MTWGKGTTNLFVSVLLPGGWSAGFHCHVWPHVVACPMLCTCRSIAHTPNSWVWAFQVCKTVFRVHFTSIFELCSWGTRRWWSRYTSPGQPQSCSEGLSLPFDHTCKFGIWTCAKIGAAFLKIWPLVTCSSENEETLTFLGGIQLTD